MVHARSDINAGLGIATSNSEGLRARALSGASR
jgi:hypothetical protein